MDAMDIDMTMDADLVPDEPIATQMEDTPSPGEVSDDNEPKDDGASRQTVPYKIHMDGLDVLSQDQVKTYVAQHFPHSKAERIEWIDDSSANLVFSTDALAQDALVALAAIEIADPTQLPLLELLPAKPFAGRSDVNLRLRFAVKSDRKQSGAASRSRFYLMNPNYDPENRRRYRDRGHGHDRNDRHDIYDRYRPQRRHGRRDQDSYNDQQFDVNLYDDDHVSVASLRSRTRSPSRSRSPDARSRHRRRSYSPENRSSAARNRNSARAIKDQLGRDNRKKELFPFRPTSNINDRLEAADKTSAYLSSRFSLPLNDSDAPRPTKSLSLADRITAPPASRGKLADRITAPSNAAAINPRKKAPAPLADNGSFSIRGSARARNGEEGFNIRGEATKTAKELFPDKFGSNDNAGKELFSDKLDSRVRRRNRAGDLFD